MIFQWYEELQLINDITQGDIIKNCYIPTPNTAFYESILNLDSEVSEPIDVESADLIILSQVCDIVNDKINSLVLCPVWSLDKLIESNEYFNSSKARESLRQGKEPSYHLLNQYQSNNISMDYSVVDFHQIFSLPKDYLKSITILKEYRLRLLPPYREHLSQAFARYFMRVGLPQDISNENIKNYKCT